MANQVISRIRTFFEEHTLKESIMSTLTKRKTDRFRFLNRMYEISDGSEMKDISMWELGKELGLSREETENVADYLKGEELIKFTAMGGWISITHYGIIEVEEAINNPDESTQYFPPVVNIMHINSMVGSQIQQGSHGSTQNQEINQNDLDAIQTLVGTLKEKIPDIPFDEDQRAEAEAELQTVEAQIKSSKPKVSILRESLTTLRNLIEGVASSALTNELLPLFAAIGASLGF
jgi:hypothetical protein